MKSKEFFEKLTKRIQETRNHFKNIEIITIVAGDFNATIEDNDSVTESQIIDHRTERFSSAKNKDHLCKMMEKHQKVRDTEEEDESFHSKSLIDDFLIDKGNIGFVNKIEIRHSYVESDHKAIVLELSDHL